MRRLALLTATALLAACQPAPENDVAANLAINDEVPNMATVNTISPPAENTPVTNTPVTNTPDETPTPPPPSKAQTDYRSAMRLTGTEPFWGVNISSGQIKMMRPDYADMTVTNPGPSINGDVAVWNARDLTIRLEPEAGCSDGMSDNRYPYKATVTVKGEVLRGCAARADQWPRGGG
jgi:uncharacterized membrane protein